MKTLQTALLTFTTKVTGVLPVAKWEQGVLITMINILVGSGTALSGPKYLPLPIQPFQ